MERSRLFRLNLRDVGRGLLMAVLAAVAKYILDAIDAGTLMFTLQSLYDVLDVSAVAGIAYLFKNFFENSQGVIGGREV